MRTPTFLDKNTEVSFREKSVGNLFFAEGVNIFSTLPDWVKEGGYTHRILLSHGEKRWAKISKTRAWVAVDEDEKGIVEEKWEIKVNYVA